MKFGLMTKELLARNACETDLVAAQRRESAMLRECWKSMKITGEAQRTISSTAVDATASKSVAQMRR